MVAEAAPGPPGPDGGAAVDGPGGGPRLPPPSDIARVVFDPEAGVTASRKEFSRAALMAAVVNALPYGFGSDDLADLQRLVDGVLRVEGYAVALVLLTSCQTPAAIRRRGRARLTAWLANRSVRSADSVAAIALEAAQVQHTVLPGEDAAGQIVADLAAQLLALDERLKRIDKQIRETFRSHPQAEIIESLPGMGPILGAEFIVAAGDLTTYVDAGHLASATGLVPVPRDSGRRTGNLHRPKCYSRRLRRVFYMSAQTSIIRDGPNRNFYLKKRSEGCKHVQAVIALARRRASVLWALLRDDRLFTLVPPVAQDS